MRWIVLSRGTGESLSFRKDFLYWGSADAETEEEAVSINSKKRAKGLADVGAFPEDFGHSKGWRTSLPRPEFDDLGLAVIKAWREQNTPVAAVTPGPRKPIPEICPEVWSSRKFDPAAAWVATRIAAGDPPKQQ